MKKIIQVLLSSMFLFLLPQNIFCQIEATSAAIPPYDPIGLVEDEFLGEGVEILNITFEGSNTSVGYFNNGMTSVGLESGILLTTGVVESSGADSGVNEPGSTQASADNGSLANDIDLAGLSAVSLFNVAKYTIEFVPSSDTLSFRYVFASEEYPEFVCSDYNDLFGFFISGPGITGTFSNGAINMAEIPGTNLPVNINNVNGGTVGSQGVLANCTSPDGSLNFSQYYVDNDGSSSLPVFDGWLTPFEAKVGVIPCETYTIKLVIADQGDPQRDSGVFLEARSFGSESLDVTINTEGIDGSIIEGCTEAELVLTLPSPRPNDTNIDLSFIGDALNGTDVDLVNSTVIIPAGQISQTVIINPLEDGQSEGVEEFQIEVQINTCKTDTFTIYIDDYTLPAPNLTDTILCVGESVVLDGAINITPPVPTTFNSGVINQAIISPPPGGIPNASISTLEVTGVNPLVLGPDIIQSICINIEHNRVEDLNIYLRSPGGQLLPLSTDNGGMGANYNSTCFTPTAISNINTGVAPFMGDWLPEGAWESLWFEDAPTNGTWQLEIVDEAFGFNGFLVDWEITFNPVFSLTYDWGSTAGLSCYDCPSPIVTPNATATYAVVVTDAFGCTVADNAVVTIVNNDFGDAGLSQTICPGGTATLTASGGDSYEWSTGEMVASISVMPLVTTTYEVTVTNSIGCSSVDDVEVVVGSSISATLDKTDISCAGANDGTITVNSNGAAPITYLWSNAQSTQTINGLDANTYTVTVTDANSCSTVESIEILDVLPIQLSSSSEETCEGESNGTATVVVQSGGVLPIAYLWDTNANDQNTSTATDLGSGSYTVTVTDANLCTSTETVTVASIDTLVTPIVLCGTVSNDEITFVWQNDVNASGFLVNVDNGGWIAPSGTNGLSHTVTGLMLGQVVNIEVQGIGACNPPIGIGSCMTLNCSPIDFDILDLSDVSCFMQSDGSVALEAMGAHPPFSYSVNGTTNTSGLFADLPVGDYTALVEDDLGCTNTVDFSIGEPTELVATIEVISEAGCDEGAEIAALVSGGTMPYFYNWNTAETNSGLNNLGGGIYTVTVTDSNNCTAMTSTNLDSYIPMTATISASNTDCTAVPSGNAEIQVQGGTQPFTYLWSNNTTQSVATELTSGQISVTVTDGLGCILVDSVMVNSDPNIMVDFSVANPLCEGESGSVSITPSGGQEPYTIDFNGDSFVNQFEFYNITSGSYSAVVTDANGCSEQITDISVDSPQGIDVFLEPTITLDIGDSIQLFPQFVNASGEMTYEWTASENSFLSSTTCPNPFVRPLYSSSVQLLFTDENGCAKTTDVNLIVNKQRDVYIPNAFSPNEDGENDYFTVYAKEGSSVKKMIIFSRWGEVVFVKENIDTNVNYLGWDGTFKGELMNSGVYTYIVEVSFFDGVVKQYKGSVTLIK